jgi:hypothetical protein
MRPKIERPPSSYRWSVRALAWSRPWRTLSSLAQSFPFDPPPTPAEERAERQRGFFSQLIWPPTNEELAYPAVTYDPESGLPRLSRACLASEVRCYGRFIIPTLFVFGASSSLWSGTGLA